MLSRYLDAIVLRTLNVHDAVMRLVEGSCDLLIAYHHASQPLQLGRRGHDREGNGNQ